MSPRGTTRPPRLVLPLAASCAALAALALSAVGGGGCAERDEGGGASYAARSAAVTDPCAAWTCDDFIYDADDGCDCGCGCWDPDCDDPDQAVFNCELDEECVRPGVCEAVDREPDEPCAEWVCPVDRFDTRDGCHCDCGCWDPDCDEPLMAVVGCAVDEACVEPGVCVADATCEGWTCDAALYDALDGCDCDCGCWDPDCDDPATPVIGCEPGQFCVRPGVCADAPTCPGWTCDAALYGAGDGCDCACGCWDADCDDPDQAVIGCGPDAVCVPPDRCREPFADDPCEGWRCPEGAYGDLETCDCDCGCWDPDCDDPAATIVGCLDGEICARPGVCRDGTDLEPPCAEWTCPASFYGTQDGCDCRCGCRDPDCDDPDTVVWNCDAGVACVDPGLCEEACVPACADRACGPDGCGGTCGDCPDGLVCDGAGRCVVPCEPDCAGRTCGFDGCGGLCGVCSAGTRCEGGDCVPCTPACAGRVCGDDGCNGLCGVCGAGLRCQDGQCVDPPAPGDRQEVDEGGGACNHGATPAQPWPLLLLLPLLFAAGRRGGGRRAGG